MARGETIWYNGKLVPEKSVRLSLFTHSLHYGIGAFEGIRAYRQPQGGGAVFRLKDHIERFHESFKILGWPLPYSVDTLVGASIDACKANRFDECYIRPLAFIGDGPLGLGLGDNPPIEVAVLTWEWGSYLGDEGAKKGVRLITSSYCRAHPNSFMTKGKITGQYVTSVLAKREATSLGYHEALLLDSEGYLTEGSGENLFIVKCGVVKTTPLTSILNGLTRQTVITCLRHQGYTVEEQRFTRDELYCADEAFLTGTAAEITPIAELDRRPIGVGANAGKPGPLTLKIQREYQAMVHGELPNFGREWLTPIR